MSHHITNLVGEIARDLHHASIAVRQSRHAEFTGQTKGGTGLGEAFGPVEVLQRSTDGRTEITELEVPLTGHRAGGQGHRDAGGGRGAQQGELGIAQAAGADLDGAHEHLAALVLVAITEEDGRRTHGAAGGVEALVGGPIVLLDAVHVLHHHWRIGRHVVGRRNAVPGSGREGATAVVAAAALTEVAALPEQVAVVGIARRTGLQQRGRTRTGSTHEEVIHNGVLVDPAAAPVGVDAVSHHIADLVGQIARHLHHAGVAARESGQAQLAGQTERGSGLGEALGPVEVIQRGADGGTEITEFEVPLTGHRAGRDGGRDAGGRRATEREALGVAELAGADLDGVDEHLAALVLVAITEEDGCRSHRAASGVEALIGGPIVLLDAIDVLGDHRRICGHVIGGHHAVPRTGREGAAAVVAAAALAEVVALPEQVTVVGVGARAGLQQRGRTRAGGRDEQIIDEGVLIDPGAAAVGRNAVGHHVTDLVGEVARNLHHAGVAARESRQTELAGQAERRAGLGQTFGPVEVFQSLAGGGAQITLVEVPLTGHAGGRTTGRHDTERPVVGQGHRGRVGEAEAHQIVGRGAGSVRIILQLRAAAGLDQLLRGHRNAIEVELHTGGGHGGGAVLDQRRHRSSGRQTVGARARGGLCHIRTGGGSRGRTGVRRDGTGVGRIIHQDALAGLVDRVPLEVRTETGLPVDQAERIHSGHRGIHRKLVLVALFALERAGIPLELADLGGEEIAGIGADEHRVGIVVVHVRAVRAHADTEGGHTGGQLQKADDFDCEVVGVRTTAGDTREHAGSKRGDEVALDVGDIDRGPVELEIDGVHQVGAGRGGQRPREGLIGHGRTGGIHEGSVDLAQRADTIVGQCGLSGPLEGADDEAPLSRTRGGKLRRSG